MAEDLSEDVSGSEVESNGSNENSKKSKGGITKTEDGTGLIGMEKKELIAKLANVDPRDLIMESKVESSPYFN